MRDSGRGFWRQPEPEVGGRGRPGDRSRGAQTAQGPEVTGVKQEGCWSASSTAEKLRRCLFYLPNSHPPCQEQHLTLLGQGPSDSQSMWLTLTLAPGVGACPWPGQSGRPTVLGTVRIQGWPCDPRWVTFQHFPWNC